MTAEQLKHIRATLGLSQQDFASLLGYKASSSYQVINRWEKGRRKIPAWAELVISSLKLPMLHCDILS